MRDKCENALESLIVKSEKSLEGNEAMKFSQAALNLAHVLLSIHEIEKDQDN